MTRTFPRLFLIVFGMLTLWTSPYAPAQHNDSANAEFKVPALTEFHETIYKVWHTAWPNKDTAMLNELLPEIEQHVGRIKAAKLPTILHEKENAWKKEVANLETILAAYKTAVSSGKTDALLNAAEELHAQYEGMARLIKPPLKEIAAFHEVLYHLYHHYLPDKNWEKVKESAAAMKEKMAALDSVVLPERMKKYEKAFTAARAKLSTSVDELVAVSKGNDRKKIEAAVETLHSHYEALDKTLE